MKKTFTTHYSVPSSTNSQPERPLSNRLSYISLALSVLLITLLLAFHVSAQHVNFDWAKSMGSIGTDEGKAIAVDSRGYVYVTGYFEDSMVVDLGTHYDTLVSTGFTSVFLSKYDPNGQCVWAKSMGGPGSDAQGVAITVDTADNIYVAGYFTLSADFDPDGSGGTLSATGYTDMFLAKYDSTGHYLWGHSVGTDVTMQFEYGLTIEKTTNNVYVVGGFVGSGDFNPGAGTATLTASNVDMYIAKYAPDGDYIWAKNIGGNGTAVGRSVDIDDYGYIYITGQQSGTIDFNPGGSGGALTANALDIFLAKYDGDGNYHWAKVIGGSTNDKPFDLVVDGMANVYITGSIGESSSSSIDFNPGGTGGLLNIPPGQGRDIFLAKYDSSGNYLWANTMGANGMDGGVGAAVDQAGNIYITGYFSYSVSFDPLLVGDTLTTIGDNIDRIDEDVFVVSYDSSGNYIWAKSMGSRLRDRGTGITVDKLNNVYLTGHFNWSANFNPDGLNGELDFIGGANPLGTISDVFVVKLSQGCEIYTTVTESTCDSFFFNNITYNVSGIYRDTFLSVNNCDSIVALDLTITGHTSANPVVSGRYCDSATFNGITYRASGIYTQSYNNIGGCDSIVTYDLTIDESNTGELTLTVCDSLVLNDEVYTVSGTYTQVLANASGCDSILTIEVIVNSSPQASVVLTGSTLTANNADTYQWVDCDKGNTPVDGAIQRSFTPTEPGNYGVIITNINGCSDTSECTFVDVGGSGINQLSPDNEVRVFPNPAQSQVHIQTMKPLNNATIRLVNMLGQVLDEQANLKGTIFTLSVIPYSSGIYFLDITDSENTVRIKVVKE